MMRWPCNYRTRRTVATVIAESGSKPALKWSPQPVVSTQEARWPAGASAFVAPLRDSHTSPGLMTATLPKRESSLMASSVGLPVKALASSAVGKDNVDIIQVAPGGETVVSSTMEKLRVYRGRAGALLAIAVRLEGVWFLR